MICGTAHGFAGSAPRSCLPFHLLPGASGHTLTTPHRRHGRPQVLTTPWETIYSSSLRSDSECEERIWILQS